MYVVYILNNGYIQSKLRRNTNLQCTCIYHIYTHKMYKQTIYTSVQYITAYYMKYTNMQCECDCVSLRSQLHQVFWVMQLGVYFSGSICARPYPKSVPHLTYMKLKIFDLNTWYLFSVSTTYRGIFSTYPYPICIRYPSSTSFGVYVLHSPTLSCLSGNGDSKIWNWFGCISMFSVLNRDGA